MSFAWMAIVTFAGLALLFAVWLADRAQDAAIDSLSTSSLPPLQERH